MPPEITDAKNARNTDVRRDAPYALPVDRTTDYSPGILGSLRPLDLVSFSFGCSP